MGLDMYLTKKRFLWTKEREKVKITGIKGIVNKKVEYIIQQAIYWRKANAIHKWFVNHVQDDKDDCGNYYVSREHLEHLLTDILTVLNDNTKAPLILPTQGGFFFGSTGYDKYYFRELRRTKKEIENILEKWSDDFEFEYHSSW